jgi:hypothetical protein
MAPTEPPSDPEFSYPDLSDSDLSELLRSEAERYDPNHDRIMQRIRTQDRLPVETGRHWGRSGWLLPAAAAASLVALIAGAITAVNQVGPSSSAVEVASSSQVTVVPSSTATGHHSKDPVIIPVTPKGSVRPGHEKPTPSPTPTGKASASPTATGSSQTAGSPGLQVRLETASAGRSVNLPGGAGDWIVAGSLDNGQTIRRRDGDQLISGPHVTGDPTSTPTDGPFSVSWSGGQPNEKGAASRWLSVHGRPGGPTTGMLVKAPAGQDSATLVLYVGAVHQDGQLKAEFDDHTKVVTQRLKADEAGYVVTIQFHTSGRSGQLLVNLTCGSEGSVALAAASLT